MGGKCSTRKKRGGGGCSSCGSCGNSSTIAMNGGYKYDKKASLASRKRLQNRLSRRKTKNKNKKKKIKRRKRTRRRRKY